MSSSVKKVKTQDWLYEISYAISLADVATAFHAVTQAD